MLFFQLNIQEKKIVTLRVKEAVKNKDVLIFQPKKNYYLPGLKEYADLCECHIKNERKKGYTGSLETLKINEIVLQRQNIEKIIRDPRIASCLAFQNKHLTVEKNYADVIFHVEPLSDGECRVNAGFSIAQKLVKSNECNCITPYFFMYDQSLYFLKEPLEHTWLYLWEEKDHFLEGRKYKYFTEDYKDKILWQKKELEKPKPILIIKDMSLCFADLHFEYEKTVASYFSSSQQGRNQVFEETCAQDLLDLGYEKKFHEFYIAQPKAFEALQFLKELEWEIHNKEGKKVLLQESISAEVVEQEEELKLQGKVTFDDNKEIPLDSIVSNLQFSRPMIETNDFVALCSLQECQKKLSFFLQKKSLAFSKSEIGLIKGIEGVAFSQATEKFLHLIDSRKKLPDLPDLESFKGKLHPFQEKGVQWIHFLYKNQLAGILADEMGLGKTVQVLAFLSTLRNFFPVLIVAPSSLLMNWKSEFSVFFPKANVTLYHGPERKADFNANSFILTTYGVLKQDMEKFSKTTFEAVILDESSAIKNAQTKNAKAAFCLKANFRLCLNGTPVENRFDELLSQFTFLFPKMIHNDKNPSSLKQKIAPFVLKREKQDVDIQLPEKIEQIVWVSMEEKQKALYDALAFQAKEKLPNTSNKMHIFEMILRLRQIAIAPNLCHHDAESGKIITILEDIQQISENHKVLVFSQFTEVLKILKEKLHQPYHYIDGSYSLKERQQQIEAFQSSSGAKVFFLSMKAAGYGLNLNEADYVIIVDPWFNEAVEKQAMDRAHRMGRKKSLIVKKYLSIDTIEEKILHLKQQKLEQSEELFFKNLNLEDLHHLLQ
ncbi:MAG: hypothetical protein COT84_00280 [Chlamydiae bacterium CG10_big_fil_rev_8_21_14_0_10_35_9]|nr:MAG: hypothetical protein COT84_00280 [Chlamydiae bacterium CG10_big_fil_rev_8_21_14_0_10_35_9]